MPLEEKNFGAQNGTFNWDSTVDGKVSIKAIAAADLSQNAHWVEVTLIVDGSERGKFKKYRGDGAGRTEATTEWVTNVTAGKRLRITVEQRNQGGHAIDNIVEINRA